MNDADRQLESFLKDSKFFTAYVDRLVSEAMIEQRGSNAFGSQIGELVNSKVGEYYASRWLLLTTIGAFTVAILGFFGYAGFDLSSKAEKAQEKLSQIITIANELKAQAGGLEAQQRALEAQARALNALQSQLTTQKTGLSDELLRLQSSFLSTKDTVSRDLNGIKNRIASDTESLKGLHNSWNSKFVDELGNQQKTWSEAANTTKSQLLQDYEKHKKAQSDTWLEDKNAVLKNVNQELEAKGAAFKALKDEIDKKKSTVDVIAGDVNKALRDTNEAYNIFSGGIPIVPISRIELQKNYADLTGQQAVFYDKSSRITLTCKACAKGMLRIQKNSADPITPALSTSDVVLTYDVTSPLGNGSGDINTQLNSEEKVRLGNTLFYITNMSVSEWGDESEGIFSNTKYYTYPKILTAMLYVSTKAIKASKDTLPQVGSKK